jgi:hypothetical protein
VKGSKRKGELSRAQYRVKEHRRTPSFEGGLITRNRDKPFVPQELENVVSLSNPGVGSTYLVELTILLELVELSLVA